jgi:hypothetical protein
LAVASIGRMRSALPWTSSVGTSILGRSARKSVSQVGTQACAAQAEAATATLKLACQACSLMRVPLRTSTL